LSRPLLVHREPEVVAVVVAGVASCHQSKTNPRYEMQALVDEVGVVRIGVVLEWEDRKGAM